MLKLNREQGQKILKEKYLNTSHVKVKLTATLNYFIIHQNLNTSHVKVKLDISTSDEMLSAIFKYISC